MLDAESSCAMRHIPNPWALGAPLYMPAHREDLLAWANGERAHTPRAMIFCTEDAVAAHDLDACLQRLRASLPRLRPLPRRYRFVRARNPNVLARLLDLPGIEHLDGFVLPKFTARDVHAYFDLLPREHFHVMPTLETREVFDSGAMRELCQALSQSGIAERILMLRIGGNDLLNLLGLRRPRGLTWQDTPLAPVIAQLVTLFKPAEFALSAPVFEYLNDHATLRREIQLDLAHGLTGKTAIHPSQIAIIEAAYAVEHEDYDMARKVLDTTAPAVFRMHDAMCEVATHQRWAADILTRHALFGRRVNGGATFDAAHASPLNDAYYDSLARHS